MTETLGYAISKTWYIVLIFVALAIGIAFLSKKNHLKLLLLYQRFAWYLA